MPLPSPRRLAGGAVRLLVAVSVGYFAFWACAPPSVLAPPVPLADGQHWELGTTAVGGVAWDTTPGETWDTPGPRGETSRPVTPDAGGTAWAMGHAGRWDLGGTAFADFTLNGTGGFAGFGFLARFRAFENEGFVIAPQLSAGILWSSLALPMALKVGSSTWLYTAPQASLPFDGGQIPDFHLPFGASFEMNDHLRLHAELGLAQLGYIDMRNHYVGLGVAWRP